MIVDPSLSMVFCEVFRKSSQHILCTSSLVDPMEALLIIGHLKL